MNNINNIYTYDFTDSLDSNNISNKVLPKKKILIVDDHKFIRHSLKYILTILIERNKLCEEFEIIEGVDGADIISCIVHDQSNNNLIKCIITDENMNFINGSEAIKIIKNLEEINKVKKIPIAFVTAFEDDYTVDYIYNSGADIILRKPCNKRDVEEFLENYNVFTS